MSGVHFIRAKNKNFDDIPISEFYFDDFNNLSIALKKLENFEYNFNIYLDLDILSEEQLENILSINQNYKTKITTKEKKYKYYKDNIEILL